MTTDDVADTLREAILDGTVQPGVWLREDVVARQLNVSRTPVREAIARLVDEGLIAKSAHRGAVVSGMSSDDILALYIVRANLEGLAARLAAQRLPPGLLDDLERIQGSMADAIDRDDVAAASKHNLEFHRRLRNATGNPYLERFLLQVEQAVRRLNSSTLSIPGRAQEALDEHAAIIAAIAHQDAEAAAREAQQHMLKARNCRIQILIGT